MELMEEEFLLLLSEKVLIMCSVKWLDCCEQNRLFLDFKPGGALCQIFAAVYKFKSEQGW